MKKISLSRGEFALVDNADFPVLNKLTWTLSVSGKRKYAVHNFYKDGKNHLVAMHRFLLNAPKGKTIDHIDGDGLNNQRANLRVCTLAENLRNRKKPTINGYPYTGIQPMGRKWRAIIGHKGKTIHLGMFLTPEDAARAYDAAAKRLFGKFARLNFKETV